MRDAYDVAIVGGGIIGTSAAAYLAEAGASVLLLERSEIGAAASGRNSGVLQHPFDSVFAELHYESLALYREPIMAELGFAIPERPAGLMLLAHDADAVADSTATAADEWPELAATLIQPGEIVDIEPGLDPSLAACRLETGYPVAPAAAVQAFARRAAQAGADLLTHSDGKVLFAGDKAAGVATGNGTRIACNQVLIAAGPWAPSLVPAWAERPPITSIWGVVVATALANPPAHALEELGLHSAGPAPESLFSLVTAAGGSSVGSTFLPLAPDAQALAPDLMARASAFVPALATAPVTGIRICARPVSFDDRPLIGPIPGIEGLYVCAGHGPWGISTGPASGRLIADVMLGRAVESAAFSPARFSEK